MSGLVPIIGAISSFLVCFLVGIPIIPYLRKLKFGQTIREDGPTWHKSKEGTPTMGGIMIFLGVIGGIFFSFLIGGQINSEIYQTFKSNLSFTKVFAGFGLGILMGLIGFFDDFIKVVKKRNLGLTASQKTFLQILVSATYLVSLALSGYETTWLPIIGEIDITSGFGLLFWPVSLIYIYFFTNAVNLTDGIDGLATTVTLIVACAFMYISGIMAESGVNILSASLAGGCLGFLVWNFHPAKIFMGDTGSMFLGGMVVALSFAIGKPIILVAIGIIYLFEALSVVLQVTYFKATGKRLFKMSPIHHHFEKCGWKENKIVLIFSLVTLLVSVCVILPLVL